MDQYDKEDNTNEEDGENFPESIEDLVGYSLGMFKDLSQEEIFFDDIGGQKEAVEEVKKLALALKTPEIFKLYGIKPPKGILFYGPPGIGKTLLAKALAYETEILFFSVSLADIGSKYINESATNLQKYFDSISSIILSPNVSDDKAILFLDEFDSIGSSRDGDYHHKEDDKVVNVLNSNLDGGNSVDGLYIIAATNNKEKLDEALIRAGRFDKHIRFNDLDLGGIIEVLKIHCNKINKNAGRKIFRGINYEEIAKKLEGLNGADIAEVCRLAVEDRIYKVLKSNKKLVNAGNISQKMLNTAIDKYLSQREISKKPEKVMGFVSGN